MPQRTPARAVPARYDAPRGGREAKALDEQLAGYAAYHRNRWNRLTYVVGVPLITDRQLARALIEALRWRRFETLDPIAWNDRLDRTP